MNITTPTLPTIHLNGTGADSLEQEYRAVRHAIAAAADALQAATCNARDFYPQEPGAWERARAERAAAMACRTARDFYPQEPGAWERARAERAEAFRLLEHVSQYAEQWEAHAAEHRRR